MVCVCIKIALMVRAMAVMHAVDIHIRLYFACRRTHAHILTVIIRQWMFLFMKCNANWKFANPTQNTEMIAMMSIGQCVQIIAF